MIELTNPTNLPDPSEIAYMEEPVVSAEIMVTTEFIADHGAVPGEKRALPWHGIYRGNKGAAQIRTSLE